MPERVTSQQAAGTEREAPAVGRAASRLLVGKNCVYSDDAKSRMAATSGVWIGEDVLKMLSLSVFHNGNSQKNRQQKPR